MNDKHGLTAENLLSALPQALREDASVYALAAATAEVLAARRAEIDRLRIYSQIDALPEELLDILAYDFKVDWWDGDYSLEEKRQTLKDSWNVHRHLGTRYAVETALSAVFPNAIIKEWFEYGGDPYCFRLDLPIPENGITEERQRRVLSRVWYYKNLRSHLESVNLQTESTGILRIGAYTTVGSLVEIWPELVTKVEVAGQANMGVATVMRQAVSIYPELPTQVEITEQVGTEALTSARQQMEIYPELTKKVEVTASGGAGFLTATRQTVEVFPSLPTQVEVNTEAGVSSRTAARQTVEIYPE